MVARILVEDREKAWRVFQNKIAFSWYLHSWWAECWQCSWLGHTVLCADFKWLTVSGEDSGNVECGAVWLGE